MTKTDTKYWIKKLQTQYRVTNFVISYFMILKLKYKFKTSRQPSKLF